MLGEYRVLDLTDERGQLAGAIFASLGAEVILVEPPSGSSSRRQSPRVGDREDAEASLTHWANNRGKRSVVLDLVSSEQDRETLRRLATGADVLIETGELAALGLGYEELRALNPALVYASITPFGSSGPKAGWAATELTVWASSTALDMTGDDDRPPVRVSVPQAFLHAAADAANGALIALHERAASGLGQHVEVSAQISAMQATLGLVLATPMKATIPTRAASGARAGPLHLKLAWPCKDGHVAITFIFGAAVAPFTQRLMDWIHEEGFCDEATRDKNWVDYAILLLTGGEPIEEYERVKRVIESFTRTKTKHELLQAALGRRLLIAPVSTIDDVLELDQLASRGYWDEVDDPGLAPQPIKCPGPFAKPSRTPLPRLGRAPRLGEHTAQTLSQPARTPANLPVVAGALDAPLAGLKVLDLFWVMAGPAITRVLADFGATVVRVESSTRLETVRTLQPFLEDVPDPERSGLFWTLNAGKLGCTINLTKPESRDVIYDLVRWADVVCESFSPRAMKQFGLEYETIRDINPSIVMLSSCLMGQTGPLASFAGFGNLAAAICGFHNITGWSDRAPAGPFGAYTDCVAPRYGLAVLLAALDHRRRTGEGQYIDMSQGESAMHFLTPAILDRVVNDRLFERYGNDDADLSPHGVYPSAGDDRWVAIACATDAQRAALATLAGGLSGDAITAWTSRLSPDDAAQACQDVGVPAHVVQTPQAAWHDPQLRALGHFVELDHPMFGRVTVEGARMRLSRTPARVVRCAPMLGQDTSYVLSELLGYDEERIGDLYARELLE